MGRSGEVHVPSDEDLRYDFINAALCLDYADNSLLLSRMIPLWYSTVTAHFADLRRIASTDSGGFRRISAVEEGEDGRERRSRLRTFGDGLTPAMFLLGADWQASDDVLWSHADNGVAFTHLQMGVERPRAIPGHTELTVFARIARHVTNPGRLANDVADLIGNVADGVSPAYGEVSMNVERLRSYTRLDLALNRSASDSALESRRTLRGYEWVTACPRELVEQIGGHGELERSGVFDDVRRLSDGGALLRATKDPKDYDDDVARRVGEFLAPILPDT